VTTNLCAPGPPNLANSLIVLGKSSRGPTDRAEKIIVMFNTRIRLVWLHKDREFVKP